MPETRYGATRLPARPRNDACLVRRCSRGAFVHTLVCTLALGALPLSVPLAEAQTPVATRAAEAPFIAENQAAMDRMMADMEIAPSGDVDADFVAMMVPHHEGAIAMAVAVLRHGRNPRIRRIAQEIIVEQQQEIAAMRLALGQPLPPAFPAPTQATAAPAVSSSVPSPTAAPKL
ncbi:DUF305 domain-containing protein [Chitinasiproducens palmae]|uniref:DUF305 domain-containing protein n=1 Tax=Chitinasiproducens palmae TaxID=1770053 RepID=A0A1H2PLP1_9BURK|nr:DUF305 domain-containing protein [Chitinasiproducens palmae]SDV47301.1 protein of unknown function [Chitinasiproducens palmae]